jgi:hypothetical protein
MLDSRSLGRAEAPTSTWARSVPQASPGLARPELPRSGGSSTAVDPASSGLGSGSFARRGGPPGASRARQASTSAPSSQPLSRSQINELLSRMSASVNAPGSGEGGAAMGAGATPSGGDGAALANASSPNFARSPLSGPPIVAEPASRGGLAAAPISTGARPLFARPHAYDTDNSSPAGSVGLGRGTRSGRGTPGGGSGSAGSGSIGAPSRGHAAAGEGEAEAGASPASASPSQHRPSRGSLELFPYSYEEEPVGRMVSDVEMRACAGADPAQFSGPRRRRRASDSARHCRRRRVRCLPLAAQRRRRRRR